MVAYSVGNRDARVRFSLGPFRSKLDKTRTAKVKSKTINPHNEKNKIRKQARFRPCWYVLS